MRFYRGIAVPASQAEQTITTITEQGLLEGDGWWKMSHGLPESIERLLTRPNLSLDDTRPQGFGLPAVCACGDVGGAAFYAWYHNRSGESDTPLLIEFEAELGRVAVDGKDFLFTAFQFGNLQRHADVVRRGFGNKALWYAERAWANDDDFGRIALCDLAIHDPEVIEAHYASEMTISGKYKVLFSNAFTVTLPIIPEAVCCVCVSREPPTLPKAEVSVYDIR